VDAHNGGVEPQNRSLKAGYCIPVVAADYFYDEQDPETHLGEKSAPEPHLWENTDPDPN
jgi:hypothetical protein